MRGVMIGRLAAGLATAVVLTSCTSAGGASSESSASTASTSAAPTTAAGGGSYLALGDSVPFGFRADAGAGFANPENFTGYPELVGQDLGLDVVNAACPGETTASFVDVTAQSNGCENLPGAGSGYRTSFPLHVAYDAADQSQLDFALQTLGRTDDVRLVTVQVGANDAFVCQSTTADRCQSPAEYQALGQAIQTNLGRILSSLRDRYDGQIVVVNYYALDYGSAAAAAASNLLNGVIAGVATANGATVADAFAAFQSAASSAGGNAVAAGLVLPNDVHPSDAGQRLLADTVEAVVAD